MKRASLKLFCVSAALMSILILSGCGKKSSTDSVAGAPGAGTPGYGIPGVPGGCVPINQQIPITGNGIYFDWANIFGGQIPNRQPIGQVVVGGSPVGGQFQRSGVDGMIALNIMPDNSGQSGFNGGQYGQGFQSTAAVTGMLQISPATQQDIMYKVQSGQIPIGNGGFNGGFNPGQICVSGIAFDLGHYYYTIYGGHVYLYLNGTQHGYVLYF